jgi:predicted phosphodiesterase
MRVAIISDVHGNFTALEAVMADLLKQKPDITFHGGDLATAGCNPAEVIDAIADAGWSGVLGNTDEMLWDDRGLRAMETSAPKLKPLLATLENFASTTRKMIGDRRLDWLHQLPAELRYESLVLLHASPGNVWRAPMDTADDQAFIDAYSSLNTSTVVYCHIHRPFVRRVGEMTVCNCGSVGSPYDGDPRASYLLIEDDAPAIRRVEYDVEKEVSRLLASDHPNKEWIAELRRSGSYVPLPEKSGR